MPEIVIRISVPDGVAVRVEGQQSGETRPFVERPAPPHPSGYCPVHDVDWILQPAGVSKTKTNPDGSPKRYNAFWKCPERGCDQKPTWDEVDAEPASDPLPF